MGELADVPVLAVRRGQETHGIVRRTRFVPVHVEVEHEACSVRSQGRNQFKVT
jgi:hypothetical protein